MERNVIPEEAANHPDVKTAEELEQMPIYEWDIASIGDAAHPFTYQITEQSIAEYCEAVRNENPLYLDREVAGNGPFGGIIAPPTYIFKCAPQRRNELMHAMGYASPEEKRDRATPYAKSKIWFYKPIRPGDSITSVVELRDKYERRGNQFMTLHVTARDGQDELVAEYDYTIIWRRAEQETSSSAPAAKPQATSEEQKVDPADQLTPVKKVETQETIDQYAELTRVRPRFSPSLHSDPDFAQRTIFGGTVNMGVATAAYCSEAIELTFGPEVLLRPGATLEYKGIRPVRAGTSLSLGGRIAGRSQDGMQCEVRVFGDDQTLCGIAVAEVVTG